jgi:hypothetical protein
MSLPKRPVLIMAVACLYIAVGAIGFVRHFDTLRPPTQEGIEIEVTEIVGLVAGIFLLRGHNWARWLAIAWIAFHVGLSAFHAWPEFMTHLAFFLAIAWILFRSEASAYFRHKPPASET